MSVNSQRALVRDSMNRLKKLRKACGKNDADEDGKKGSGDPYRDLCVDMAESIKAVRTEIDERNEMSKKGLNNDRDTIEKSLGITKEIREMEMNLAKLREMLDKSETDLNKAIAKKKSESKVKAMENLVQDRRTLYNNMKQSVSDLKDLDSKRIEPKAGLNPEQQMLTNKRDNLRKVLMQGGSKEGVQTTAKATERLEDDIALKQTLDKIKENEKKIDRGLDILLEGVKRLGEHARNIGRELDEQNAKLTEVETKMDKSEENLTGLNKRLDGIIKAYKPQNTMMTVCCCVLLIAMVGYLVYEFTGGNF